MLLVIVGHVVLGSVHDNLIRYTIYAFHMPLFIGISGYLINTAKLRESRLLALLQRYWWRVLLPFMLAFVFYTGILIFHAHQEERLSQQLLIAYLHTPYYHLWFVPTLVLWVLSFWVALKMRIPLLGLLITLILVTALWAIVDLDQLGSVLPKLLSKKVVYFFSFFLFGVWLNTKSSRRLLRLIASFKVLPAALVLLCGTVYLMGIGDDKTAFKGAAWLIMNLALIGICVVWILQYQESQKQAKGRARGVLIAMGRVSLPIYLWHMLPMFFLKGFDVHETQPLVYYLVSLLLVGLIVALLIALENHGKIFDRLLYGR